MYFLVSTLLVVFTVNSYYLGSEVLTAVVMNVFRLLGYSAVCSVCEPMFRRNVSLPASGPKINRA
jgi:hypothetical protein